MVIKDFTTTQSCRMKLNEIAQILANEPSDNSIGLLQGDLGRLLFLFHYADAAKSMKYFNKAMDRMEQHIENVDVEKSISTYCGGLTGLCWLVEYIAQKGWLEADTNEILSIMDRYLNEVMMHLLEHDNYDFLHGSLGIGVYFTMRASKSSEAATFVENYFVALKEKAIYESDGSCRWFYTEPITGEKKFRESNLGISHGIPAILSFLTKTFELGIRKNEAYALIKNTTRFIVKNQVDINSSSSFFPCLALAKTSNTRLAWCYGDLGVCCALRQAALILEDEDLMSFIKTVLLHASTVRNPELTKINDACWCHGAAGVAHVFRRFFDFTGHKQLKDAADFWYRETLNFSTYPDGPAGYKFYLPTRDGRVEIKPCLNAIEGISGIGLALLYPAFDQKPTWEKAFLIT